YDGKLLTIGSDYDGPRNRVQRRGGERLLAAGFNHVLGIQPERDLISGTSDGGTPKAPSRQARPQQPAQPSQPPAAPPTATPPPEQKTPPVTPPPAAAMMPQPTPLPVTTVSPSTQH